MEAGVIKKGILGGLLIFCCWISSYGQSIAPLERIISVELTGQTSREALKLIEEKATLTFAYKTDIIEGSNSLQRSYSNRTVREILNDLFQGSITYKERGEYILLKEAPKPAAQEVVLEGYVTNATNGAKIGFASLYDTLSLTSTVTDVYGYYKIRLSTKEDIVIRVRREGFRDTTFKWTGEMANVQNLALVPDVPVAVMDSLSVDSTASFLRRLKNGELIQLNDEQRANLINFKDRLKRSAQFSVVPGVGTNGKLSSVTTVDYSFNLLGGFNGGVRVAEIGGLFNMIWDSVSYFQLAGLLNMVEGPVSGVQIGGLLNLDNDRFHGVQIGGLLNRVAGDTKGVQVGGLVNLTGRTQGVQIGGLVNASGDSSTYVQVAGLVNNTGHSFRGIQIGGLYNNQFTNGRGAQVAGLINRAGPDFQGVQISGLVNQAATMKGAQIGFINISDSLAGVAIGFFSYSKHGLHQLEVSANESFAANLAFRSGNHLFYNSFSAGGRFINGNRPIWRFGYGVGTSARLGERSRLYMDLTSNLIYQDGDFQFNRALNTLEVTYQYQLSKTIGLAIGPNLNLLMDYDVTNHPTTGLASIAPYTVYHSNWGTTDAQIWIGGKVALRFF